MYKEKLLYSKVYFPVKSSFLLRLLRAQARARVDDSHIQLLRPLDNLRPFLGRNIVRDLRAVFPIMHQEHLDIARRPHRKLVKAIRQHVTCLFVRPIADIRHAHCAAKLPAHRRVDTLRPPPALLYPLEPVALVAPKLLRPLLYDRHRLQRSRHPGLTSATQTGTSPVSPICQDSPGDVRRRISNYSCTPVMGKEKKKKSAPFLEPARFLVPVFS